MENFSDTPIKLYFPNTTFSTTRATFEPADTRKMFEIDGRKVGVVVCEDFWNDKTFLEGKIIRR
jgi:predicted amidohydrolase